MSMADQTDERLRATAGDLPEPVADALARPAPGSASSVDAAGTAWGMWQWGAPSGRPVLLVHGVTSDAGIWWRIAPALAAAGFRVTAVDMPGHGRTAWRGRHRFAESAADLASFIRAAGLDEPDLAVVGHSWGAMVTARLPAAGVRPRALVLLDPPALTVAQFEVYTHEPTERPYASLAEATAVVRAANPTWSDGDIEAKAHALTAFDADAVLALLLQNGDWDAGMAALRGPGAAGVPVWLIRGESATGGFIPDDIVPAIRAQLGRERVITIADGPHSPQRTHPEATLVAILRALG
jgi:pimeloyl-ACP methyl ester carboxylesterase